MVRIISIIRIINILFDIRPGFDIRIMLNDTDILNRLIPKLDKVENEFNEYLYDCVHGLNECLKKYYLCTAEAFVIKILEMLK